ncbi:hypothetical protein [Pseudochrobactrum sp. XF203]|uniref:hypothetical protein n=1 Tax=Pseudochrobactrum sp. XF203 TaxID=2879116 RepID=UPI001CE3016B|nr:hypothetical protein [Pseudochrobactrum sp. XF203]UCA47735.1 hypothetical protein LDL70_16945 [Pseudochrobactrum sp. XF203]
MRNLLTSFLDQRETIGNLLAPFLTGQPQQFAPRPNPNMLLQGAEAAQQPAPPLPVPIDVLQQQVAQVPRAVDPMPTHSTSQAMPAQPPQSKSGGFFDGLSKFGKSDFGQRLGDMFLGWGMGGTMQDSLSKGSQMIAAGNQDRKTKKNQNQTVEWLKSKGMDESEAQAVASDRASLNAYLIAMRKGVDPMQALQQRKMELEIQKLENPQLSPSDQLAREKFEWEKNNGGGATEYGLNPIWGQDDQGKPVLGVLGKNGSFKQVDTGGFDISSGTEQIDLGDSYAIKDKRSGQIIGSVPKNLANAEKEKVVGKAQGEAFTALPSDLARSEQTIADIDTLLSHDGLSAIVGPADQYRPNWTMGASGRDALTYIKKLQGGAFLQAFGMLKGGGAITEIEGAKAEAAMARMDRSLSEDDFKTALKDFRSAVSDGMQKLKQKAGGNTDAAYPPAGTAKVNSQAEFDALPSGTQFTAPDGSIRRKP